METQSGSTAKFYFHKWTTFAAMYVGYTLIVLDRKSFSFALPAIMNDLNLDKDDLGLIASSQNLAYTISKFLGGIVSDSISSKVLFSSGLALAGIFTAAFTGFHAAPAFAVLWFLQGFVQGGVWPACAKILRRWSTTEQFGLLWSILTSAMNLACAVGPLLTTFLCSFLHWHFTMQTIGLFSIIVAILAFMIIIDSPADIGFDSLADAKDKGKTRSRGRGTWQDMTKAPFMWLICSSYLVVFMTRTAALDWAQLFLIEEAGQTEFTGSSFISALETGGFIGTIVAGFLGDKLVSMSTRDDTRGTPRMTVVIGFITLCIVSLHCLVFTVGPNTSQIWISIIGFMFGFGLYGPISMYGVMAIESAPTHLSGTSHAMVALSANVGAILAGLPLSIIATYFNWKGAFILLEFLLIIMLITKMATRHLEYKMIPIKKKLQ